MLSFLAWMSLLGVPLTLQTWALRQLPTLTGKSPGVLQAQALTLAGLAGSLSGGDSGQLSTGSPAQFPVTCMEGATWAI